MFTGIVEETGTILAKTPIENSTQILYRFSAKVVLSEVVLGESIAVNGCCLTVVKWGDEWWEAVLSQETLERTSFEKLQVGQKVNMERAVRVSDRLGGHLVQGHVDAVGTIVAPVPDLVVAIPQHLSRYIVEKGSITVEGVSLTVVEAGSETFSSAIIPHTSDVTNLGEKQPGDLVNIEVDVMAKYAEKLLLAFQNDAE